MNEYITSYETNCTSPRMLPILPYEELLLHPVKISPSPTRDKIARTPPNKMKGLFSDRALGKSPHIITIKTTTISGEHTKIRVSATPRTKNL